MRTDKRTRKRHKCPEEPHQRSQCLPAEEGLACPRVPSGVCYWASGSVTKRVRLGDTQSSGSPGPGCPVTDGREAGEDVRHWSPQAVAGLGPGSPDPTTGTLGPPLCQRFRAGLGRAQRLRVPRGPLPGHDSLQGGGPVRACPPPRLLHLPPACSFCLIWLGGETHKHFPARFGQGPVGGAKEEEEDRKGETDTVAPAVPCHLWGRMGSQASQHPQHSVAAPAIPPIPHQPGPNPEKTKAWIRPAFLKKRARRLAEGPQCPPPQGTGAQGQHSQCGWHLRAPQRVCRLLGGEGS